uniref:Ceramide kinase-like n=1 Tax=Gouania willdenowi TaxID=441366 RepID=A0A8C5G095_GOUWI
MFGFGGRSLALAEKKRWMSSSRRREYALIKTLARLRCKTFFYKLNNNNIDPISIKHNPGSDCFFFQGLYLSISIMSIPCLSPHAPRGLAPNTRYANGSASLIAVGNTTRSEFIKHLKRYNSSSGQLNFSFVEAHDVSAVRVGPLSQVGCSKEESEEEEEEAFFPWNIDGELVEIANEVLIKVHPRLITLYGEEVDEVESTASCSCI